MSFAVVACIGAAVILLKRQEPAQTPAVVAQAPAAKAVPVVEVSAAPEPVSVPPPQGIAAVAAARPAGPVVESPVKEETVSNPSTSTNRPAVKKTKPPLADPMAREALAWVGADPTAEAYWISAINDPSIPAEERKDLVEDLNEDGLPDPRHPTREDLPLLINRILLIEDLAPHATDQVNAAAFAEAYKDLLNLVQAADNGTAVP